MIPDWVNNLKKDDKVIMKSHYHLDEICKVERITKTLIITSNGRFSKTTLKNTGQRDTWNYTPCLIEYTKEKEEKLQNIKSKNELCTEIEAIKWEKFTLIGLQRIKQMIVETGYFNTKEKV
jgi:hypothetical protein